MLSVPRLRTLVCCGILVFAELVLKGVVVVATMALACWHLSFWSGSLLWTVVGLVFVGLPECVDAGCTQFGAGLISSGNLLLVVASAVVQQ